MIKTLIHVGISVVNLERSVAFYREVLRMEVVERAEFEGTLYERILALKETRGKVVLLRYRSLELELFEFIRPPPKPADPDRHVCDHGITHFSVEVSDIEAEYKRMKAAGVVFHCPPLAFAENVKATYARDPDGNVFELVDLGGVSRLEITGDLTA
jgi:catechol 2,3-dioxygenase-like lactoylglutathione lyase family enzyme